MINAFSGGATSNAGAVVDLRVGATVSATGVCSGAGPYIFEIARHPERARRRSTVLPRIDLQMRWDGPRRRHASPPNAARRFVAMDLRPRRHLRAKRNLRSCGVPSEDEDLPGGRLLWHGRYRRGLRPDRNYRQLHGRVVGLRLSARPKPIPTGWRVALHGQRHHGRHLRNNAHDFGERDHQQRRVRLRSRSLLAFELHPLPRDHRERNRDFFRSHAWVQHDGARGDDGCRSNDRSRSCSRATSIWWVWPAWMNRPSRPKTNFVIGCYRRAEPRPSQTAGPGV